MDDYNKHQYFHNWLTYDINVQTGGQAQSDCVMSDLPLFSIVLVN